MTSRRAKRTLLNSLQRVFAVLCLVLCNAAIPARAEVQSLDDGGAFDVRSAYLEPRDHAYYLNATLDLALAKSAEQAIKDGVPVTLQLDVQVIRPRKVLMDERVATASQKWRLQYHALSDRYLVIDLNNNTQISFSTLSAALTALSDVHLLPVMDASVIRSGARYDASVRISVVVEGGLPNSIRAMMFWIDWKHVSEWYTWTVTI